ncbi:MAG: hypothetical protein IIC09_06600 [Proteobacteria bacterium]|nr:hypothetical protein [Pseudomonadota bacterium]
MYFNSAGKLRSMPASWTDVAEADAFQQASTGRSWFRIDDLLDLLAILQTVKKTQGRRVK